MTDILDSLVNAPQPIQAMLGLLAGILFGLWVFNPIRIR